MNNFIVEDIKKYINDVLDTYSISSTHVIQHRNTPTKILNIVAKSVSCGDFHTVIIDMNNEVWSFGNNRYGELGLCDYIKRNTPTKIPGVSHICVRRSKIIILIWKLMPNYDDITLNYTNNYI